MLGFSDLSKKSLTLPDDNVNWILCVHIKFYIIGPCWRARESPKWQQEAQFFPTSALGLILFQITIHWQVNM